MYLLLQMHFADSPNFISIQGDLPQMPVYDALINSVDSKSNLLSKVWCITALTQTNQFRLYSRKNYLLNSIIQFRKHLVLIR